MRSELIGAQSAIGDGRFDEAEQKLLRYYKSYRRAFGGRLDGFSSERTKFALEPSPAVPVGVVNRALDHLLSEWSKPPVIELSATTIPSTRLRPGGGAATASEDDAGPDRARVSVDGAIADRFVRQFFNSRSHDLSVCFEDAARRGAAVAEGDHVVSLTVEPTGDIRSKSVSVDGAARRVEQCFRDELDGASMPPPVDGEPVDVEYTVTAHVER